MGFYPPVGNIFNLQWETLGRATVHTVRLDLNSGAVQEFVSQRAASSHLRQHLKRERLRHVCSVGSRA